MKPMRSAALRLRYWPEDSTNDIDKKRPADDILPGHKPPIAAVITDVAIIAHDKEAVGRHQQILALDMGAQGQAPFRRHAGGIAGGNGREIVAVRIVAA